jgi:6-methylsalicylate decarboxylase
MTDASLQNFCAPSHNSTTACGCAQTRRRFVQAIAAAGAGFAASRAGAAPATSTANASPRRIDVHHHCFPKAWFARKRAQILASSDNNPSVMADWTPQRAIDQMDRYGIRTGVASVGNPGVWYGDVKEARDLSRSVNDYMAQMARDFPGRFGVFAALPLPDPEGCLREIEYACDTLKADGFHLLTSYGDKWPGDPAFFPVFDELNRRKAIVFVHPTAPNCCSALQPGIAPSTAEFLFDEARAVMSLMYNGVFSRCPDIRFIFTHAGGPVPVLAARMEQELRHPEIAKRVPRGVAYELKRLYFDVANSTVNVSAMDALRDLAASSHILFGTDFPYIPMGKTVGGLGGLNYSPDLLAQINRDNALTLFPRFA